MRVLHLRRATALVTATVVLGGLPALTAAATRDVRRGAVTPADVVRSRSLRGRHSRSMIVTFAWPPPSHMVCSP
ncbi:hypothetical protein [Streptomyces sp. NPDC039028]|uniref:hypothetical protein n=1 Tax=unclassified Streptomyces TaxID=2593676 RepID=UPI0033DC300B